MSSCERGLRDRRHSRCRIERGQGAPSKVIDVVEILQHWRAGRTNTTEAASPECMSEDGPQIHRAGGRAPSARRRARRGPPGGVAGPTPRRHSPIAPGHTRRLRENQTRGPVGKYLTPRARDLPDVRQLPTRSTPPAALGDHTAAAPGVFARLARHAYPRCNRWTALLVPGLQRHTTRARARPPVGSPRAITTAGGEQRPPAALGAPVVPDRINLLRTRRRPVARSVNKITKLRLAVYVTIDYRCDRRWRCSPVSVGPAVLRCVRRCQRKPT